jgi:hypothetical protein
MTFMMQLIRINHLAPSHGWLKLNLTLGAKNLEINASDVPNNPIQDLITALDIASRGADSFVWWHLEPAGYFLYFHSVADEVRLKLDYADNSERSHAENIVTLQGSKERILLPFWRFVRKFQSYRYQEPDWPALDYRLLAEIKSRLSASKSTSGSSVEY